MLERGNCWVALMPAWAAVGWAWPGSFLIGCYCSTGHPIVLHNGMIQSG